MNDNEIIMSSYLNIKFREEQKSKLKDKRNYAQKLIDSIDTQIKIK